MKFAGHGKVENSRYAQKYPTNEEHWASEQVQIWHEAQHDSQFWNETKSEIHLLYQINFTDREQTLRDVGLMTFSTVFEGLE